MVLPWTLTARTVTYISMVIVRPLEQNEYHLLDTFCEEENIPRLNPEWSKVIAAIDEDSGRVVGIMVAQMQIHVEPIWIKEGYRNKKVSADLADALDGYLDGLAVSSGQRIGVWANPTNLASERIVRLRGFQQCESPVFTKVYDGDKLSALLDIKEG